VVANLTVRLLAGRSGYQTEVIALTPHLGYINPIDIDITAKECAFQHTLRSASDADAANPVAAPIRPSALSINRVGAQRRGQFLVPAADCERAVFRLY
jgi:hypothetical protein